MSQIEAYVTPDREQMAEAFRKILECIEAGRIDSAKTYASHYFNRYRERTEEPKP